MHAATGLGYVEYPSHYRNGLDSPVALVFEVTSYSVVPDANSEPAGGNWFTVLPDRTHADEDRFLLDRGYLTDQNLALTRHSGTRRTSRSRVNP
jgi:hypothetical protein